MNMLGIKYWLLFLFFRSAFELFAQFDSTQMVFNPTIPLPKQGDPKLKRGRHYFINKSFKPYYQSRLKHNTVQSSCKLKETYFDFYKDIIGK